MLAKLCPCVASHMLSDQEIQLIGFIGQDVLFFPDLGLMSHQLHEKLIQRFLNFSMLVGQTTSRSSCRKTSVNVIQGLGLIKFLTITIGCTLIILPFTQMTWHTSGLFQGQTCLQRVIWVVARKSDAQSQTRSLAASPLLRSHLQNQLQATAVI